MVEPAGGIRPHGSERQKEEKKPHPKVEKAAREKVGLSSIKTPSREQGKIIKEYLAHFEEKIQHLPQDTIQLVEATRLLTLMTQGLAEFEKGGPYLTTSKSGELVTIKNKDKQGFVNSFLEDLSYLLKRSEGSTLHKTNFYALVTNFIRSKTFLSLHYTQEKKEPLEQKSAEQAFISHPSLETFADISVYAPGVIVHAVESSEEEPEAKAVADQKNKDLEEIVPFFLQNVQLLLKNAQHSLWDKKDFYNVIAVAEKSAEFSALYPDWQESLVQKKQHVAHLSFEKLLEQQSKKEKEFLAHPSIKGFKDLASFAPKMEQIEPITLEESILGWKKLLYKS
jgi:hypothetical protein